MQSVYYDGGRGPPQRPRVSFSGRTEKNEFFFFLFIFTYTAKIAACLWMSMREIRPAKSSKKNKQIDRFWNLSSNVRRRDACARVN